MNILKTLISLFVFINLAYANEKAAIEFARIYKAIDNLDLKFNFKNSSLLLKKSPFKSFAEYVSIIGDSLKTNNLNKINECSRITNIQDSNDDYLQNSFKRKSLIFCINVWGNSFIKSKSLSLQDYESDFLTEYPELLFELDESTYLQILDKNKTFKNRLVYKLLSNPQHQDLIKKIPLEDLDTNQISLFHLNQNSKSVALQKGAFSREIRRDIYKRVNSDEIDFDYFRYLTKFIDNNTVPDHFVEDIALDNIARSLISNNKLEESYQVHTLLSSSIHTLFRSQSLVGLILSAFVIDKPSYFQKTISSIKPDDYINDPALSFWVAHYYRKVGLFSNSQIIFENTARKFPFTYYGTLSLKFLKEHDKLKSPNRDLASDHPIDSQIKNLGERFSLWNKLGQNYFKEQELRSIINGLVSSKQNKGKFYSNFDYINELFVDSNDYLSMFKTYYEITNNYNLQLSEKDIRRLFPTMYDEIIERHSKIVPTNFVLSIMRQESTFNPRSYSSAGAMGLLQLLPSTAKDHVKLKNRRELYEPAINIKAGVRFLERLIRKYDGDLIKILSAYNAGEGNVKRWLSTYLAVSDPFIAIEMIPFQETRNYVKLIYRNYYFYNLLSDNKNFLEAQFSENIKIVNNN
ncbi:MAG: hypothetical protein Fur0010_07060 [Bdellovibrio sp.]